MQGTTNEIDLCNSRIEEIMCLRVDVVTLVVTLQWGEYWSSAEWKTSRTH
jgi:hypothetical protein